MLFTIYYLETKIRCKARDLRPCPYATARSEGGDRWTARRCFRPAGALGIERAKQAEIDGWGERKLEKYIAKKQKLEAEKKGK